MSAPSISVLLPVHNAGRFLRAAVASILAQTHRDFELIAVDDGSTDASGRILDAFAATDSRVRLISRPNTGIVGALNDGLAVARGEFIARMDADDIAEPGRLEQQLAHLLIHPEIIALGTFARVIDPAGHVVGLHEPPCGHDAILARLLDADGGALLHPSLVFRRSALEVAGAYDPAFCRAEQRRLLSTIVRRERAARGLPGHDPIGLSGPSDYTPAELHRHWACGARRHGTRHAALRHAFAALLREGPSQANWRTLRYVTGI
jgi:glycosyltransferase involved in cell wall biosynthesis